MDVHFILFALLIFTGCVSCSPVELSHSRARREADSLAAGNWDSCQSGGAPPETRVDTTARVDALRALFDGDGIQAYIIPSEDAHQSEYPSDYDKRRGYISGFQGSAGTAVVTKSKQALWTDGRYFLEAEDTLDCHWILMRSGETGVPSLTDWLVSELNKTQVVGASPFLVGSATWTSMAKTLNKNGITLKKVDNELIDQIWNSNNGRPAQPSTDINALPLQFAGRSWQDKIRDMRNAMADEGVDVLVVTGLDETAWLFNLRASDIAYNPFFISYAVVDLTSIRLYILDKDTKLTANASDAMTDVTLATHLNTNDNGVCDPITIDLCVEVLEYDPAAVVTLVRDRGAAVTGKVWLGYSCNYAIYSEVPEDKIHQDNTPVATTKCRKNDVEREGMKKSHIRDAVALISFMAKLEKEVIAGKHWTEVSAAEELKRYRGQQLYNRGLSFGSISSSGANGAIIHYGPTNLTDTAITTSEMYLLDSGAQYLAHQYNRGLSFNTISSSGSNGANIHYSAANATDKAITANEMYLLDSGGQYLDGTTDVTRTFHFGTPTQYQKKMGFNFSCKGFNILLRDSLHELWDPVFRKYKKNIISLSSTEFAHCVECYTRVLMGHINLFHAVWPKGLYGREIDAFARAPLWDVGLIYRHGTGHGIGMYLSVHEGPAYISKSTPSFRNVVLDEYQFISNGPGRISLSHSSFDSDEELDEFQYFSDEPGYYEAGQFGIRLENIVMVKNATTTYSFPGTQFLTFEHVTLVPYEPKLIDYSLLNEKQMSYMNDYHKMCRDIVGPELQRQGESEGYKWLMQKATHVSISDILNSASRHSICFTSVLLIVSLLVVF